MRMLGKLRRARGVSLLQMTVAVAIMAILIVAAMPTYRGMRARAYIAEARYHARSWATQAWQQYTERGSWSGVSDETVQWEHPPSRHWQYGPHQYGPEGFPGEAWFVATLGVSLGSIAYAQFMEDPPAPEPEPDYMLIVSHGAPWKECGRLLGRSCEGRIGDPPVDPPTPTPTPTPTPPGGETPPTPVIGPIVWNPDGTFTMLVPISWGNIPPPARVMLYVRQDNQPEGEPVPWPNPTVYVVGPDGAQIPQPPGVTVCVWIVVDWDGDGEGDWFQSGTVCLTVPPWEGWSDSFDRADSGELGIPWEGGSQVQGWTLGIRGGNVVFIGEGPQPVGGAIAQVRTPANWYDVGADVTLVEGVGIRLKRQTSQYFYTAMVMRVSTGSGICEPNRQRWMLAIYRSSVTQLGSVTVRCVTPGETSVTGRLLARVSGPRITARWAGTELVVDGTVYSGPPGIYLIGSGTKIHDFEVRRHGTLW